MFWTLAVIKQLISTFERCTLESVVYHYRVTQIIRIVDEIIPVRLVL